MYGFKEHTADVKLYAYGKTFSEALEELMKGILTLTSDIPKKVDENSLIQKTISISSKFREDLVVKSIEELLFLSEKLGLPPFRVKILESNLKHKKLKFKVWFYRGEIKDLIKSPTYHELNIKNLGNKWLIEVVLDV